MIFAWLEHRGFVKSKKVIACELNKERLKHLEDTVRLSGVHNIEVLHGQATTIDEIERLNKLASFQKKALAQALRFPQVERIVYKTWFIHYIENEDVTKYVLPLAAYKKSSKQWSSTFKKLAQVRQRG